MCGLVLRVPRHPARGIRPPQLERQRHATRAALARALDMRGALIRHRNRHASRADPARVEGLAFAAMLTARHTHGSAALRLGAGDSQRIGKHRPNYE